MTLWFSIAAALEPELGVHGLIGLSNTSDPIPLLFGGGAQVAIDPWRRFHLEFAGDAGLSAVGTGWVGLTPRGRLFAGAPEKTVLSAVVGGGVALSPRGPRALVEGGFAVDLLRSNGPRPRIQAVYAWEVTSASRLILSAGLVFGRKAPLQLEPPPPPPPTTPSVGKVILPDDGMIWLPGPACVWLPSDEAKVEIERLGMVLTQVTAISPRSIDDPSFNPLKPTAAPAPIPGKIAVASSPSDTILSEGVEHPSNDGLSVFEHADGRAEIEVFGGGRRTRFTVGVVENGVVWVDVPEPPDLRILFASGSATITPTAKSKLAAFANDLGEWRVQLYGSYSPEGDPARNQALAARRADAVRAALLTAGLDSARIEVLEGRPSTGLSAAEMRNATLVPVEAP